MRDLLEHGSLCFAGLSPLSLAVVRGFVVVSCSLMMDSRNGSPDSDAVAGARLVGWKAIAGHLHLGVRTAQRWEREFDLPVRRISHDRRDTVFAYVAELDAWLASSTAATARNRRWDDEPGDGNGEPDVPLANGEESDDADGLPDTGAPTEPVTSAREPDSPSASTASVPAAASWRRRLPWFVALAAVAIAALAMTWRNPTAGGEDGEPSSVRIGANGIAVLDDSGHTLWSRPFARLETDFYSFPHTSSLSGVADLDGDGHVEVWFAVAGGDVERDDLGLYVFNYDGQLRWRHRYAGAATFGDHRYGGPWVISRVQVTRRPDDGPGLALWVVSRDSSEFPCVLHRVDPKTGRTTGAYWSAGWITSLALVRANAGYRLLVGSAFNEGRAPGLALLDATAINGSMPAANPKYRCVDCPGGGPIAFTVFPKPRRFAGLPGSGTVDVVAADGPGGVFTVRPIYDDPRASAIFRLDAELKPLHADVADPYFLEYERLVREGAIQPVAGPAVATDRELLPVLRWQNGAFVPVDIR